YRKKIPRRLISQRRKPSNPNGKLAVMSLWVKSGHMQCNNPCLLWARSGHPGITQLLIIFPSVLDRFRGSRHTQKRQRGTENATHLRQMGLLSIASRPLQLLGLLSEIVPIAVTKVQSGHYLNRKTALRRLSLSPDDCSNHPHDLLVRISIVTTI